MFAWTKCLDKALAKLYQELLEIDTYIYNFKNFSIMYMSRQFYLCPWKLYCPDSVTVHFFKVISHILYTCHVYTSAEQSELARLILLQARNEAHLHKEKLETRMCVGAILCNLHSTCELDPITHVILARRIRAIVIFNMSGTVACFSASSGVAKFLFNDDCMQSGCKLMSSFISN